jgi:hypothetical protein
MKIAALVLLTIGALGGCSENRYAERGGTTQMFPDCNQVSAEQQQNGRCMRRPDN